MKRSALLICVFLAAAVVCGCEQRPKDQAQEQEQTPGALKPGSQAPDFALKNTAGLDIRLHDLKGSVVVLEFWATWCPPCRAAIPELASLNSRYSGRGVKVLGIATDTGDDLSRSLEQFGKEAGINYPILLATDEVLQSYGIMGIPATFLIDREGRLVEMYLGAQGSLADTLGQRIEKIL